VPEPQKSPFDGLRLTFACIGKCGVIVEQALRPRWRILSLPTPPLTLRAWHRCASFSTALRRASPYWITWDFATENMPVNHRPGPPADALSLRYDVRTSQEQESWEGGWYNEKAGEREPGGNRRFGRKSILIVDQARSAIGVSGRAGASLERGRAVPSQGICLAERVQSITREGQGRPAHAGRGSGHLLSAGARQMKQRARCSDLTRQV